MVRVYADTGELLRTETLHSPEEYDELLKNTSRGNSMESAWDEATDTVTCDPGNGITLTLHYDEAPEKDTAVLKQNGKVLAESSHMMMRPYMVDESDEDFIPAGWMTVRMSNDRLDENGDRVYEEAGFLIADRKGSIVYRETEGSSYYITLVDENFCVLFDWASGKYIIRDYSGRDLFSWIRPEEGEFW